MSATASRINADLIDGYHPSIGGYRDPELEEEYGLGKPPGMPSKEACDVIVRTKQELKEEVQKDDIKIWVEGTIDATGVFEQSMGNNVVLSGDYCDPSTEGRGSIITQQEFYNGDMLTSAYGTAPTLYGISFVGPMVNVEDLDKERDIDDLYFDPREAEGDKEDYYTSAIHAYDTNGVFGVYGCEFVGWPVAGVRTAAKGYLTDTKVRWCTFRDCCMETYGYGVTQFNGHTWIDQCAFSRCRHYVAGFGRETEETEVTECLTDTKPTVSHQFDKHETTDEANIGGHHFYMRNCTLRSDTDIFGNGEEGYKQRGVPITQDELWFNHFWHEDKPENAGEPGSAIYQEGQDDWVRVAFHDNIYGEDENPDFTKFGAPPDPKDDNPTVDTQTLSVIGTGPSSEYKIVVDGDATVAESADKQENVEELSGTLVQLTGQVGPYADAFELSEDATIISGIFSKEVQLRVDGRKIDINPLISAWIYEKYEN